MNAQNPTLKRAMIKALEKTLGIVTSAALEAGIDRGTHYVWLKDDPEYKEAVESISDMAIDFVESALHKQIKDGSTSGAIFYLKTKAKARGYIERVEQEIIIPNGSLTIKSIGKDPDEK